MDQIYKMVKPKMTKIEHSRYYTLDPSLAFCLLTRIAAKTSGNSYKNCCI